MTKEFHARGRDGCFVIPPVYCGRRVFRMLERLPERGDVHHLRGRNVAPADRYNPRRAVLLCALDHALAQRHEITIKAPR